ncbi:competence protein ComK [Macrococcus equipercicus]|uniref:Competence protein ComK n=1 Tax=Macrococcus equipercicus TaxID=69967 RepID=A0A9Q9BUQ4_9STAP|nr:competence protein ComK [Macrococcus equipercicus]KAA1042619.1 hypothetical protein ERX35_001695 [Macrococcus equipercicus]UTH14481.1 competence protein ComK [Macrococcus equipercicus]
MKRDLSSGGQSEIMLRNGRILKVDREPEQLLNETLIYLGSNLKARRSAAKHVHQIKQFIPIVIDSETGITFFPLHRQTDYCRYYINSFYYLNYADQQITFTNQTCLKIALSEAFVRRQYEKSLTMMDSQKKIREQKIKYDY